MNPPPPNTHTQEQLSKAEERAGRAEAQAREARAAVEGRVVGKERELAVQEAHFASELVRACVRCVACSDGCGFEEIL